MAAVCGARVPPSSVQAPRQIISCWMTQINNKRLRAVRAILPRTSHVNCGLVFLEEGGTCVFTRVTDEADVASRLSSSCTQKRATNANSSVNGAFS